MELVSCYWQKAFPNLVSYNRFVEWLPSTLIPLMTYLRSCLGKSTGIGFIDSTSIKVGHIRSGILEDNRRIKQHKVFKAIGSASARSAIADRGKTSVDWFYGFKLHLAINHRGELLNVALTTGNIDERKPVKELLKEQHGQFFGDLS